MRIRVPPALIEAHDIAENMNCCAGSPREHMKLLQHGCATATGPIATLLDCVAFPWIEHTAMHCVHTSKRQCEDWLTGHCSSYRLCSAALWPPVNTRVHKTTSDKSPRVSLSCAVLFCV